MDYQEIGTMGENESKKLLAEQREELRLRRFQAAERQLRQLHMIRAVKKTIARLLTALKQKAKK